MNTMGSRFKREVRVSVAQGGRSRWRQGNDRLIVAAVVLFAVALVPTQAAAPRQQLRETPTLTTAPGASPQRALLNQYCVSCHNERMKASGSSPLALDTLDVTRVGGDTDSWEKVVLKLRAGLMPPAGRRRPDKATSDGFASWLEQELDRAAAAHVNPGRTEPFHRLNRAEYQNAVRDLLGLTFDVSSLLPTDDVSVGFDNIASVLTVSPTLMDRYLAAAQKISRLAVGLPTTLPSMDYFRIADDLGQDDHLPGLPFGTRGGTKIRYTFPTDGEYAVRVKIARDLNDSVPIYTVAQDLEVSLDGRRLQVFTLPGGQPPPARGGRVAGQAPLAPTPVVDDDKDATARPGVAQAATAGRGGGPRDREARNRIDDQWQVRVPVTAGDHDVVVAFLKKSSAIDETPRLPFLRPYPAGKTCRRRVWAPHYGAWRSAGRALPEAQQSRPAGAASLSVRRRLPSRERRQRAQAPRLRSAPRAFCRVWLATRIAGPSGPPTSSR